MYTYICLLYGFWPCKYIELPSYLKPTSIYQYVRRQDVLSVVKVLESSRVSSTPKVERERERP